MTPWIAGLGVLILIALVLVVVRGRRATAPGAPSGFVPYDPNRVAPRGWVLVDVQGLGQGWVDPTTLRLSAPRHELAPAQVERIRAFKEVLGDNDPTTLEQAIVNFSGDAQPDAEIAIWERIAQTWSAEVEERGVEDPAFARLLYTAVLGCSLVEPTPDALVTFDPRLKAIPDLAGLADRYRRSGASPDAAAGA